MDNSSPPLTGDPLIFTVQPKAHFGGNLCLSVTLSHPLWQIWCESADLWCETSLWTTSTSVLPRWRNATFWLAENAAI